MKTIQSVCVYCGSSPGNDSCYKEVARQIGKDIAKYDLRLVYGGGTKGLMGEVSKAVQENNGKVTGIIPKFLIEKEADENEAQKLDELIITENMHQRKLLMFDKADAFIALPGGIGTLEELVEMLTWAQLDLHQKPIILVNIDNFWTPFLNLLEHMAQKGFLHNKDKIPLILTNTTKDIIADLLKGSLLPSLHASHLPV